MTKELLRKHYEKHRPLLHFTSRKGWMNDPNGLIYHEGYYHLFYQYYPDGVTHGPMHWGHARTSDFLSWEELPIALYPDEKGTIFSGCMVYDKDNTSGFGQGEAAPLVAVFTHNMVKEGKTVQYQSLAYSLDGGMTFEKYEKNPVLDLNLTDFRDPKVFWDTRQQRWVMLTAAGQEIRFFASGDLKEWSELSSFAAKDMKPDEIWECPDLQELTGESGEKRWVLFVSQNTLDYAKTGVRYFVGEFDEGQFRAADGEEEALFLDFGRDNYAAATYGEVSGRVIQQGWMNCWAYAAWLPEAGFRGSMTLPRELHIRKTKAGWRIIQTPVRELWESFPVYEVTGDSSTTLLQSIPGIYKITFENNTGQAVFQNRDSQLHVKLDFEYGKITVDRSKCARKSYGPHFQESSYAYFHSEEDRNIWVILDVTSVEVFAADGEAVGTFQYFTEEPLEQVVIGK